MIKSYSDYLFYLESDRLALNRKIPRSLKEKLDSIINNDSIWTFQKLLRKTEYYDNCEKKFFLKKLYCKYLRYKLKKMEKNLNIEIWLNIFGPGLCISHMGGIIVHERARIGANCKILNGVSIGMSTTNADTAPIIGDNVFIGSGAKIIGPIILADNIAVGANAVVNKSFIEKGISIGGVPAKKISAKGTEQILIQATKLVTKRR